MARGGRRGVDLRFPHRGEVSGSLRRAMQAGSPTIVSATGTYLDVPDDAVLRVAPGPTDPSSSRLGSRRLRDDRACALASAPPPRPYVSACASDRGHGPRIRAGDRRTPSRSFATRPARRWRSGARRSSTWASPRRWWSEGYGMDYARALRSFEPRRRLPRSPGRFRTIVIGASGPQGHPVARLARALTCGFAPDPISTRSSPSPRPRTERTSEAPHLRRGPPRCASSGATARSS